MYAWGIVTALLLSAELPLGSASRPLLGADTFALAAKSTPKKAKTDKPRRRPTTRARDARPDSTDVAGPTPSASKTNAPAALPPPRALPTAYKAVALLPLVGTDVDADTLQEIQTSLLNEVDETAGMRGISPADVTSDLSSAGLSAACEGDLACLSRAGRYAGAHLALVTRVAIIGGTINVALRLVDTQAGVEVARAAEVIADEPGKRAVDLHGLAVQTLASETYVGALRIQCRQEGAEVMLDDKPVGTTPLKDALTKLRAGPHILRVAKEGFVTFEQFIDVAFSRSSTVDVDLATNTLVGIMVQAESTGGTGALYVLTDELGLEIRIDGEPRGTTLLSEAMAQIPAGQRRLSLRKTRVTPLLMEVQIQPDRRTDIFISRYGDALLSRIIQVVPLNAPLPTRELASAQAQDSRSDLDLASAPPEPPPAWRLPTALGLSGAGAAALLVGGYFGWRVHQYKADGDAALQWFVLGTDGVYRCADPVGTACTQHLQDLDSLNDRGTKAERYQWYALAGGAALALAGGGLLLWHWYDTSPASVSEPSLSLSLGPTLTIVGRF